MEQFEKRPEEVTTETGGVDGVDEVGTTGEVGEAGKRVKQGDAKWFAARHHLETASDGAALGGFHPTKTTLHAIQDKLSYQPPEKKKDNAATSRGQDKEALVRAEYCATMQALHPHDIITVDEMTFARHAQHRFLGGSPDGVVKRNGVVVALLEIKTAFVELYGCMPTFNKPQVQILADILNIETIHFVCWMEHGVHVVRAKRNRRYMEQFVLPRLRATFYLTLLPFQWIRTLSGESAHAVFRPRSQGVNAAARRCTAATKTKQQHRDAIVHRTLPPARDPVDEEILVVFQRTTSPSPLPTSPCTWTCVSHNDACLLLS